MSAAFAAELDRLGPGRPHSPFDLAGARAYCRRLTLGHYENFTVASLLLPRRLLAPLPRRLRLLPLGR